MALPKGTKPLRMVAPEPSAEVVTVTPGMAELWLKVMTVNRPIRANKVIQYACDMLDGNWKLTGEAIKFSASGHLLDGQHRLKAIIDADTTVEMFVIRDLPDDTQPFMDTGIARLASDNLHIAGETHPTVLSGAARIGSTIDRGLMYRDAKLQTISHAQIYSWVQANPSIRRSVQYVTAGEPKKVMMRPSVKAYSHFRFAAVDSDAADEFFASLGSLVNIPAGSPIHALNSRLWQIRNKSINAEVRDLLNMTFRAWNAWRSGRTLRVVPLVSAAGNKALPEPR